MYRLFIDAEVLEFVGRLKKRDRDFLVARFHQICGSPANHRDCEDTDPSGRLMDGHITGRFAITYWVDFADRHLKIMEVSWADTKS